MVDIENYIRQLTGLLRQCFGTRLLYVGLQGSYLRGEATADSDIDVAVVLDTLTVSDLDAYRAVILSMEYGDKSCGFICGREDLANWNPLEICHLLGSTKDCYGALAPLVPGYTQQDVRNFVKLSVNNLYHGLCHSYIHAGTEKSAAALPGMYKSVFFILQSLQYLACGEYVGTKAELLQRLTGKNRIVLARAMALYEGEKLDFSEDFRLLFDWCRETLQLV